MPKLPDDPDRTHLTADDVHALLAPDVQPTYGPDPTVIGLQGVGAKKYYVSADEARKRREFMSGLLATGASTDQLMRTFTPALFPDGSPGFNMTEFAVLQLRAEVRDAWGEEDRERAKHAKSAAIRRHHAHIKQAAKKGAYTAVAMLEKTLAQVEGTLVHRVQLEGDAGITSLLMAVIGEMDPAEVRKTVEEEARRQKLGLPTTPPPELPPPVAVNQALLRGSRAAVDALGQLGRRKRSTATKPGDV